MDIARRVFSVIQQADGWYWRLDIKRVGLIGPFTSKEDAEIDAKETLGIKDREAPQSTFKMGFYGAGTLSCRRGREGTFITFNNNRIARLEQDGTWFTLQSGWKVTNAGSIEVLVQLNEGDGVILPHK
jgi:hypothetical protein